MKKKLFMIVSCLLMSGLAFCQNYSVTLTVTPVAGQPCAQVMNMTVHAMNYKLKIKRTLVGGGLTYAVPTNYPPYGLAHPGGNNVIDFYQLAVNPAVTTNYTVEVWDATNTTWMLPLQSATITVYPSCNFKAIKTVPGVIPNGRIASPEDPHESTLTELEVKWKLEEIDLTSGEAVFTLEDPLNWAASDAPGASNAFNGFNGFDAATSVTALQAGDIMPDAGIFDPEKIYRVTRSTKYPNETEWLESTAYIGAGMDEVLEERSAAAELIGAPELFTFGQNREAKTVIFNTTTDSGTLEICDVAGNKVKTIDLQQEVFTYEMNAALLGKGLYVVQMQSGAQATVKKFTIE